MRQLPGTGDAFYKAHESTAKGTWSQMRDGQTVGAAVRAYVPPYIEYGALSGIMEAWSGGDLDEATGIFYGTGGGHLNSNFDGVYSLDFETGATALPLKPSVVDEATRQKIVASWKVRTGWYGFTEWNIWPENSQPGRRSSIHTYNMAFVVRNKFYLADHYYDLATWALTNVGTPGAPNTNGVRWGNKIIGTNWSGTFTMTMVDGDHGFAPTVGYLSYPYIRGQGSAINYSEKTYSVALDDRLYTLSLRAGFDDPVRFPAPQAWWNPLPIIAGENPTTIITSTLTGPAWSQADMEACQFNTQVFNRKKGLVYIPFRDWSAFLTWNPRTGARGKVVVGGARPSQRENAAYGRLQWYAKRERIVLLDTIDEPLYVFNDVD